MSDASISKPVWVWDPDAIAADLRDLGFDVDTTDARLPEGGGSLTGRRDRGEEAHLIVVDSGGRLRLRVTTVEDEQARREAVGDVQLRVIRQHRLTTNVTGTIRSVADLLAVLEHVRRAPRPGTTGPAATTPVG